MCAWGILYPDEVSFPLSISLLFLCTGDCECQREPRGERVKQQSRLESGRDWQGPMAEKQRQEPQDSRSWLSVLVPLPSFVETMCPYLSEDWREP